jgi:hypothetical protein
VKIIMTSGKRLFKVTDLPHGSLFFAKPYQLASVTDAVRELLSDDDILDLNLGCRGRAGEENLDLHARTRGRVYREGGAGILSERLNNKRA